MVTFLQSPIGQGAVTGFVAAAAVDFLAFRSFKTWQDVATFDYRVAGIRWVTGIISGIVAALGLGAL
jgi:hypothetical protein